jgi:Domain of unknown function (DUF4159)
MSRLAQALVVSFLLAATAVAQDSWMWGRGWGRRYPPRLANEHSFDGGFNFCRLMYGSVRREAGGQGWGTDYPDADVNFSTRFSELTRGRISRTASGDPNHLVVRPTDDFLFQCPFVLASDVGTMALEDPEVERLRDYLVKGGFLWVDDFWGPRAWSAWSAEIARVLPPAQYPIRDLPPEHPINRTMFEVFELPQIPSIQFWRQSGGQSSERGFDSAVPRMRAIVDARDRIMVLMTHNTDISDAWEREAEDPQFFYSYSPQGYAVGLNVVLYAMSH